MWSVLCAEHSLLLVSAIAVGDNNEQAKAIKHKGFLMVHPQISSPAPALCRHPYKK